jgi:hypothetical protein
LAYWTYLIKGFFMRPLMMAEIMALAVKGHHYFTITDSLLSLERFKERLERLKGDLESRLRSTGQDKPRLLDMEAYRNRLLKQALHRCRRIHPDFRESAMGLLEAFRVSTASLLAHNPA